MSGPLDDEHELRYEELRLAVYERRRAAAEVDQSDPRRGAAIQDLIEAADELLRFEDRLPVLLDLPARALSVQVVRAAALAALLGAVLTGLGIWRELMARGWLVAVLVAMFAAGRLITVKVAPAAGRHRRQRWAAGSCGGAALLLAPVEVVFGWWAGLLALLVLVVALAVLLEVHRRSE
jgi:hypothetical protein